MTTDRDYLKELVRLHDNGAYEDIRMLLENIKKDIETEPVKVFYQTIA